MKLSFLFVLILIGCCSKQSILPDSSDVPNLVNNWKTTLYGSKILTVQPLFKLPIIADSSLKLTDNPIDDDELNLFRDFVSSDKIGKEQKSKTHDETHYFTTYLGKIFFDNTEKYCHVISQFYTVQAANCRHGHSRLAFLDENKKTIKMYVLDMPNELPVRVNGNELVFRLDNRFCELKMDSLPDVLCLPLNKGCY